MLEPGNNRVSTARLLEVGSTGDKVSLFTFQLEGQFTFMPGQYVWLVLPELLSPDPRGSRRALSIVGIPNEQNTIQVAIRMTESGFKQTLARLPLNEVVQIIGPFGSAFCLPEADETPVILCAGGIGIAPFISLAREYAKNPRKGALTILCSDESRNRMPCLDELEHDFLEVPGMKVIFVAGRLTREHLEAVPELQHADLYVSGPQGFIDHIYSFGTDLGLSPDQFHFENFYPTLPSTVTLHEQFLSNSAQKVPGFFQLAVKSSSEHIVITDVQGVIVFANNAAERITGYTGPEMLGQTPRLWGGQMSAVFYRKLWRSKHDGIPIDKEIINRRKDGSLYEVMAHIAPIRDQFEQIIGYIGTEEDISSVRKAEREAHMSEQRFLDLVTAIPEVYWIIELQPTLHMGYISPSFEQIWGADCAVLHKNVMAFMDYIHPDDRARVTKVFRDLINNQVGYEMEYRVVRPDEQIIWVNDKREAVVDEMEKVVRLVGVVRDITQKKTIDQAKTEFVSLASHQLKTPIGALNWDAESLLHEDHGALTPKQREVIEEMYKTNLRMRVLVNSLLNISRLDMGTLAVKVELADPSPLCEGIVKDLRGLASERQIEIVFSFDARIPQMSMDIGLLNMVVQNLISNAVKYSPEGKKVTVELLVVGDCLQFQVTNEGDPIADDEKDKIFTKLYRGTNALTTDSDGNGLGLYMVKSIVDLTGGRIFFTSTATEGTIFTVRYPLGGMVVKNMNISAISN